MELIKCQNCGKEMNDTEKRCSNCGNQLLDIATKTYLVNKINHKKIFTPKKQKIVMSISIIGLILAGCIMFIVSTIMNDDYNKAKSYYLKNETSNMVVLYTTMSDVDSNKIFDYLEKNAQRVSDDYIADKISYENAISNMNKIKLFYKENTSSANFAGLKSNIKKLYQSRKSYEAAENDEKNNELEVAYENYKNVIQTDLNYNNANDKMNTLRPIIASQLYASAKQAYEASNYSDAVDYMKRALSYDKYNQDMLKFIAECSAQNAAQRSAQIKALDTAENTAKVKESYQENTTTITTYQTLPTVSPTVSPTKEVQ